MAAYVLTKAGARVVMLEAGPSWFASRDSKMMVPSYATPHRGASIHGRPFGEFDACDGGWEIDGEPYTSAPGHAVQLVARAHARRAHESLGAHLAPLRPGRFPRQEHRRPRRRLADRLRRRQAVLRQHRSVHRPVRHRTKGCAITRTASSAAAEAALLRAARQEGVGQAEHHVHSGAAVDHHEAAARPAGVPLLRPVQSRLSGEGELLEPRRADRAGAADGQAHAASRTRWRAR